MSGINDRIIKLAWAFETDGFSVEETIIESGRIGVRASHKNAFDYDTGLPSTVFAITQRETPLRMLRYGIYCFVLFVGSVIAGSWLMFLIAR